MSTAIPMRRMREYREQIFAFPPLQATIEGEIAQEPERRANENHQRCSSHHREGWRNPTTQRGYGEFEAAGEFPGGKVEAGETPEQAIVREIKEELNADIAVRDFLVQVEHDYPTFHLSMKCYFCTLKDASFQLLEHHAAKWLDLAHIESVDWLPADMKVVGALEKRGEL